jgi:hypothetical protein
LKRRIYLKRDFTSVKQIPGAIIVVHLIGIFLGVFQHFRNTASFSSVKPEFESTEPLNITAVIGQTTHLPCMVRSIGDRTVSTDIEFTVLKSS